MKEINFLRNETLKVKRQTVDKNLGSSRGELLRGRGTRAPFDTQLTQRGVTRGQTTTIRLGRADRVLYAYKHAHKVQLLEGDLDSARSCRVPSKNTSMCEPNRNQVLWQVRCTAHAGAGTAQKVKSCAAHPNSFGSAPSLSSSQILLRPFLCHGVNQDGYSDDGDAHQERQCNKGPRLHDRCRRPHHRQAFPDVLFIC